VHCEFEVHAVVCGEPAIEIVDPGPGFDAMNSFPETSNVNPPEEPTYALDGAIDEITGAAEVVIVAVAVPDCAVSSALVATTSMRFGDGGDGGATYSPVESMEPHAPAMPHPAPEMDHVTC
jgi:hypothetical protein